MYNNPYMYNRFFPNMSMGMGAATRGMASGFPMGMNTMRGMTPRMAGMGMGATRGMTGGLFSRLGGMFSSIRGVNWGGFINNASKTVGVINKTIPLVKQAGPMFRNMRSVMKVASLFKDETDSNLNINSNNSRNVNDNLVSSKKENNFTTDTILENNTNNYIYSDDNSPIFFVN